MANLTKLRELSVAQTHVTDLAPLANLTKLEDLAVDRTQAGHIAHFKLGTKTYWNVTKKIRKYYVIRTPEPYGS